MERMYKRPNAPPRIAEAFASLRRWRPERNAPHRSTISNLRASCASWDGSLSTS